MNLGFNSNVRLGNTVYHVQTEDRGASHPFVDTTVYAQGRVLHRRSTSYRNLLGADGGSEAVLEHRVEQQHRDVIEELRAGALKLPVSPEVSPIIPPAAPAPPGIHVQLLNPASWLVAGTATLAIEVCARGTRQPAAGVSVEVMLEGAQGPARFGARTDPQGRAEMTFPLPQFGPGGAALVIRAAGTSGQDEIRYQLRPRARPASPQAPVK